MRLELTKKTDLALQALGCLAEDEVRRAGAALAEEIGATRQFLPQVMAPLVQAGWVDSIPGPHGGYQLLEGLDVISVLDLIEAIEGQTDRGRCVLTGEKCPRGEVCALHSAWTRARAALLDELSATSVAAALAEAREVSRLLAEN
jgi:Rrf2 family transcriptional regulator, iron-sulfur cluster assembly transcription factor